MPDGMEQPPVDGVQGKPQIPPDERQDAQPGAPLDGVMPPASSAVPRGARLVPRSPSEGGSALYAEEEREGSGEALEKGGTPRPDRKKLLLLILGIGGAFSLFYLLFAFYLMAVLPDPTGGGRGLKLIGNAFYGSVSVLSVLGIALLALRSLRTGLEPAQLPQVLLRPGIAVLVLLGIAGMVFLMINQQVPLPIDIIEPRQLQGLTAPTSVTFGTQSLRSILRKQGLAPRKYKWDFDGNGVDDATTEEHEVTTVYRRKGTYRVRLNILLSDNSVRGASLPIGIPNAVFAVSPESPVLNEEAAFSATDLVNDPANIERILWDFNGDGATDLEEQVLEAVHTFTEVGTYQVRAVIQHKGGLQETFTRPVTVLKERKQPFGVSIEVDGDSRGSAPLGVLFRAVVEHGVNVRTVHWRFVAVADVGREDVGEEASGERVSFIFGSPGDYRVILKVTDATGRVASTSAQISVLEPLELRDIVITGTPRPSANAVEGMVPLEVNLAASTKTPFITFRWEQEQANRVFSVEGTYRAIYEEPGTFPLLLIAKDAEGRVQKFEFEVRVLPPRSRVSFTAMPSTGIVPLIVSFDASQSFVPDGRITGFSWTFGDGGRDEKPKLLGAKVTHKYQSEGTFSAVVRAITEDGQTFEARKTIVVLLPVLDACAFPSRTTGEAPMGVRFDAGCSAGNIVKYVWDFGDGATSEQTDPAQDHVFNRPGTYTVTLEVEDGQGGADSTTVIITVR